MRIVAVVLGLAVLLIAAVVVMGGLRESRTEPPRGRTLYEVTERDELRCGVSQRPFFGFKADDDTVTGFEIEFCKAIAAAVLGDPEKVEYVDASDTRTRYDLLDDAEIDVLMVAAPITASLDVGLRIDFAQPIFYRGEGFLVRTDSGYNSTSDLFGLDEGSICLASQPPAVARVLDYFASVGIHFWLLGYEPAHSVLPFFWGRCDVLVADFVSLAVRVAMRDDAAEYKILPEVIAGEPLAPAVREDDSLWLDVINWVINGLIAAEELGITQANVTSVPDDPGLNSPIRRLLGVYYERGELWTPGFVALEAHFMQRAIAAVGNYGEIYDRTIGDAIPRTCTPNALAIDDSVDCPPGQGGLLYAHPYR